MAPSIFWYAGIALATNAALFFLEPMILRWHLPLETIRSVVSAGTLCFLAWPLLRALLTLPLSTVWPDWRGPTETRGSFRPSPKAAVRPGANRTKRSEEGVSGCLAWAASEMQGWRPAMEDATCILCNLSAPLTGRSLFAVFDGHGGKVVSKLAARQFPQMLGSCAEKLLRCGGNVQKSLAIIKGSMDVDEEHEEEADPTEALTEVTADILEKALYLATMMLDEMLRKIGAPSSGRIGHAFDTMGSTAVVAILDRREPNEKPTRVTVCNCGDSRALLCRHGKAVPLSDDHKPELPQEEQRIRRAGGHVATVAPSPCPRVDGVGLNLSRALGDFAYKSRTDLSAEEQKVTAAPDVRSLELSSHDEFLVLACDGVFELNDSQEVVDLVRRELKAGSSLTSAAETLLDASCSEDPMASRGLGTDNCSAIVVRFR